jgi:hypothetical protein
MGIYNTGQQNMSCSLPVVIASDQPEISVVGPRGATSAIARVATSTTSAQILAANAARILAVIVNESNRTMFIKFGTTASATDYTYQVGVNASLEVERYTGRVDAILDIGGVGNAQVTEVT